MTSVFTACAGWSDPYDFSRSNRAGLRGDAFRRRRRSTPRRPTSAPGATALSDATSRLEQIAEWFTKEASNHPHRGLRAGHDPPRLTLWRPASGSL